MQGDSGVEGHECRRYRATEIVKVASTRLCQTFGSEVSSGVKSS